MLQLSPLFVLLLMFLSFDALAVPTDFITRLIKRDNQPCNGDIDLCSRKYSNISFVGTHDSPFVGLLPTQNQDISVKDQLDRGVRFLQSQIHPILGIPFMCHTKCALENAGLIENYLKTIKDWLDGHPREVITLLMTNPDHMAMIEWDLVFKRIGLDKYAFIPATSPSPLSPDAWPTLGELINSAKRLVVFVDYTTDEKAVPYMLDQFNYFFEGPYDTIDPDFAQCDMARKNKVDDDGRSSMYLVNHYLDFKIGDLLVPDRLSAAITNSANGSIASQVDLCVRKWGRPPNVILVDYLGKGNALDAQFKINSLV